MTGGVWGATIAILLAALPALLAYGVPLTRWATRLRGREAGIYFDDPTALRVGASVDTVLLDRWGTVTTGQLRVTTVEPLEPDHDRNLRWFAGALGHESEDPVGQAIARLAARGKVSGIEQHDGAGISGSVDRHPVRVGAPGWLGMAERDDVGVTVGVQVDSRPIGYITVADDVRPDAAAAVERLRSDGVDPVLVSEDTDRNTGHLAELCGIEHWHAGSLAAQRPGLVADYRGRGRVVAVASGSAETSADLALSDAETVSSGIRLRDLDVTRVARALALTRRAARRVVATRRVGLVLGAVGVVLAAVGVLTPVLAAAYAVVGCAVVTVVAVRP
ncbi:HAD family hydrolase [Nocardioides sp. WS12]|uniref:HAD family hydrolase n=1 Tax=Nocardioides sp. WS12 TaxID=2486272 RepID=UPI0015FAB6AF|nr:HAD family hydrolase [Nocardioides sp. WS12]